MASKILTITDISSTGEGIAREDGKVFFVAGALPGQTVEVAVIEEKKRFSRAVCTSVVEDSVPRSTVCEEDTCGGCLLKAMPYEEQLHYKEKGCVMALAKIARIENPPVMPIVPSPTQEAYRTKVEFSFGYTNTGTLEVGYHEWRSSAIAPITTCAVAPIGTGEVLACVREILNSSAYDAYVKGKGFWRYLVVQYSTYEDRFRIHCITADIPSAFTEVEALFSLLEKKFPNSVLIHSVRSSRYDVAVGEHYIAHVGEGTVLQEALTVAGRKTVLEYGMNSFFQVNTGTTEAMYEYIAEYIPEDSSIVDICCGVGSIALCCSSKLGCIRGIEYDEEAVLCARINAERTQHKNATFYTCEMKSVDEALLKGADVVLCDPPRGGMAPETIQSILQSGVKRIVYVSCAPATLARDIQLLTPQYTVRACRPFDMFPHTPHCESVTILEYTTVV